MNRLRRVPSFLALHRRFASRRPILGCLVLVCGIAIPVGCGGSSSAVLPPFGSGLPAAPAHPEIRTLEHRMAELVNRDRKKNLLPPLSYDERLADAARSHALDMHQHHFFDHESPSLGKLEQRLTRAGYLFVTSRENLAEAPDIVEAETGLLHSPHHYENLMSTDITSIGIGIVRGGVADPRNLVVTQIFATPGRSESDTEALQKVIAEIRQTRSKSGQGDLPRIPRLDAMAKHYLEEMKDALDEGNLRPIAKAAAEELGRAPMAKVTRLSVGGQVVVDSSQFLPQGALLDAAAKGYGIAASHGKDAKGAKRLKVLFVVGL